MDIGKQYNTKDNQEDKSGFKCLARLHQSKFRAKKELDYDGYGNFLMKVDGEAGHNFYPEFGIFNAVENYRPYNKQLYSNMLRSEHIPFNFFIPFRQDLDFCKKVFNEFLGGSIKSIEKQAVIDNKENVKIEYAPKPKMLYLNDGTSFDTYIEYTHLDNTKGILGIEVKYTEQEYELSGLAEEEAVNNLESKYHIVSNNSNLYKPDKQEELKSNEFRQIWRNHMLGESILQYHNKEFHHFTSITFFPKRNVHFLHTSEKYIDLLSSNKNNFLPILYEEFFMWCYYHCPNQMYLDWINYLTNRYIVR